MLDINVFVNKIKAQLGSGYNLYKDYGTAQEAYRTGNVQTDVINGIYRMSPLTITPVYGLFMATGTAEIELTPTPEQLDTVQAKINEISETYNGTTEILTDSGYNYTVRYTYSTGYAQAETTSSYNTGKIIPVRFIVSYTIFENGIMSDDTEIYLDGEQLYQIKAVYTRKKVTDTYPTEDSGKLKAINAQNGFGVDIVAPIYVSDISDTLYNAIMQADDGLAHCLDITQNDTTRSYIVIAGDGIITEDMGANVGCNISFVEADEAVVNFSAAWSSATVTTNYPSYTATNKTTVFWGDGTSEVTTGSYKHVYTDGLTSHTIRTFDHTANTYRALRVGDTVYGLKHGNDIYGATILVDDDIDLSDEGFAGSTSLITTASGSLKLNYDKTYIYVANGSSSPAILNSSITKGTMFKIPLSGAIISINEDVPFKVMVKDVGV